MQKEIGRIGQRRFGGIVYEEFLPELRGSRGVEIYREIRLVWKLPLNHGTHTLKNML